MNAYQITPEDLIREQKELSKEFSVVCKEGDHLYRVSYEKGQDLGCICGIFPFEDSDIYLDLNEQQINRSEVDENALPTIAFMERLFVIKSCLNARLKMLGAMPLDGSYYVKGCDVKAQTEGKRLINWIADFSNAIGSDVMSFDAFTPEDQAKVRYVHVFKSV